MITSCRRSSSPNQNIEINIHRLVDNIGISYMYKLLPISGYFDLCTYERVKSGYVLSMTSQTDDIKKKKSS